MINLRDYKEQFRKPIIYFIIALILACYLIFIFLDSSIEAYFLTISAASFFYLAASLFIKKIELKLNEVIWITFVFFLIKVLAIGIEPVGSDDYYRYLWDGKVLINGINPFQFPPNSPYLDHLETDLLPSEVTYPHIKTIYFPLSQAAFAAAFLISGESILGLKILILFTDLIITIGILLLLKKMKIDYKFLLIYVLSPLIFYQFIIDLHIDLIGIAFFLFAILFYKDRKLIAALFLSFSLMVKPAFIIAIPIFFFFEKEVKRKLIWALFPVFFLAVSFIPFTFGVNPLDTFFNFTRHWYFNGALFNLLSLIIDNSLFVRFILFILFVLIYLLLLKYNTNIIPALYYSMFILLIFSPIVHPWYAAWLIVLIVIYQKVSGILYISLISLTFYTVLIYQKTGVWEEYLIVLLIEYVPVIIFLFFELREKLVKNSRIRGV